MPKQMTIDYAEFQHQIENLKRIDMIAVVTGNNSWVTVGTTGYSYKTINGIWRLCFNISGSTNAVNLVTISLSGIVFKNVAGFNQALCVYVSGTGKGYANPNTGNLVVSSSANETLWNVSGDVELNLKPV